VTSLARLQIDPNRRTKDGRLVLARLSRATRMLANGERVVVYEPEDGVQWTATVHAVMPEFDRVTVDVDWDSVVEEVAEIVQTNRTVNRQPSPWQISWVDSPQLRPFSWGYWDSAATFPRPRRSRNAGARLAPPPKAGMS
jgi:hypothetical protein